LTKSKKILLIGGRGTLGSAIVKSKVFKNLDYPKKKDLNLLKELSIKKYINKKYNIIINCAAIARMKECEKNPLKAIKVNVIGTLNLVREIMKYEEKNKKKIQLIHISTDGVYPSNKGNYTEKSLVEPYNIYGWTKLCAETVVKMIKNHTIIRTRFFNKKNIRFDTAATDIFTSMIEVENLVKKIKKISLTKFVGIVNIGDKKKSDFVNYKKFKTNLKPCKRKDILKNLSFSIAKDASMNLNLYKKLTNNL